MMGERAAWGRAVLQELSRLCVVCVPAHAHAGRMPASDCCCRSSAFCRFISREGRRRRQKAVVSGLFGCVRSHFSPQTFATAGWDFRMRDAAGRRWYLGKGGGYRDDHELGPPVEDTDALAV